jgi:predicted transcriptional regulator
MATKKKSGERKSAIIRLDNELMKEVKILAVRQDKAFNSIVEEALRDLLKKYPTKK